jgi:hypothetical protein
LTTDPTGAKGALAKATIPAVFTTLVEGLFSVNLVQVHMILPLVVNVVKSSTLIITLLIISLPFKVLSFLPISSPQHT